MYLRSDNPWHILLSVRQLAFDLAIILLQLRNLESNGFLNKTSRFEIFKGSRVEHRRHGVFVIPSTIKLQSTTNNQTRR